jgi:hypothetical protein
MPSRQSNFGCGARVYFWEALFECLVTNAGLGSPLGPCVRVGGSAPPGTSQKDSYLVDPASSHMLVSKIKPCMSKYKQICTVKLRMAH